VLQRIKWFKKNAASLKNYDVLDVGCNAAILAIDTLKHANSYIGIEPKEVYYKQALVTKRNAGLKRAKILNVNLKQFAKIENDYNYNAIILSRILYHLYPEEILLLEEKILHKCGVAIVVCGAEKKEGKRHNDFEFWNQENVVEFFKKNKFNLGINYSIKKFFAGVATR